MSLRDREVKRVLVMIEHADEPGKSEVYDLTDLMFDVLEQAQSYQPSVSLKVRIKKSYDSKKPEPILEVAWSSYIKDFSPDCGNLSDAINFGMPDGETSKKLRNQAKRLRKKADDIDYQARVAKLEEISKIRNQHPIAVVSQKEPILTGGT